MKILIQIKKGQDFVINKDINDDLVNGVEELKK